MPGEKTEEPTPKKVREAREKGQVFKSQDFTQALMFVTAAAVISAGGRTYVQELGGLMKESFQPVILRGDMPLNAMLARMGYAFSKFLLLSAPLLGALMAAAAAANFHTGQGPVRSPDPEAEVRQLNPLEGFKKTFFSGKVYIELVKNLIKFTIVFWILYSVIRGSMRDIVPTVGMRIDQIAAVAGKLLYSILFKVGGVFLVLGGADYMIQKKLFMKDMKMSKEEVKQEYKEMEGDPHVKHMRKHLFEQMMHESVAHNVPKATVIVANPTHFAIALKYDEASMQAPQLTAKGQDSMALKIIEIAKQHEIPVVRNIGLAHSLYDLEVGHDIPEDLYEAVAEVLNFVYQLAAMEE